jgi:4-hydroxy-tetrahydrodipicolinate synthase
MGGSGVISVLAQALPHEFSKMVQNGLEQKVSLANSYHYKLLDFVKPLFEEGNPAGIKVLLNQLNICQKTVRLPLVMASNSIDEKFKLELQNLEAR